MKKPKSTPAPPELQAEPPCAPADYRHKMRITEALCLPDGSYCFCPRCHVTLERDYQRFCDRCGQRLDWSGRKKLTVINHAGGFEP